jgi:hypothetical protein
MSGRYKTFEELMGKVEETPGSVRGHGAGRTAGRVGFEELMGRGQDTAGTQRRRRDPEANAGNGPGEVPLPGLGENAPERAPGLWHLGEGRTQGEPVRFGLNFLHTYWESFVSGSVVPSIKYGGDAAPYADAGELGATIARQVGLRDLMWALVAYDPMNWHTLQTGQEVGLNVATQLSALRPDGSKNYLWLSEALAAAHAAGVKVLLTFGSMGAEHVEVEHDPLPPRPGSGSWEPTVTDRAGNPYALNPQLIYTMDWHPDHLGRSLDGVEFPVPLHGATLPGADWHMKSLDVSSPYKRGYLRKIAVAVGNLLQQVHAHLQSTLSISLSDVVEGIELFNEVEHGSQYARTALIPIAADPASLTHPGATSTTISFRAIEIVEPYESSYRWGQACFQAAYGLRTVLDALADGDEIKIRLPGICSYSEGINDTWEYRLSSLKGLVTGFVDEAVSYLSDRRYGPGWSEPEILAFLPRVLQGIDYHWYHTRRFVDDEHIQHIGHLVCELARIEETLLAAVDAAWTEATRRTETVLGSFPVSVMESGTPATTESDSPGHIVFVPPGMGLEEFQAFEVFRRLGGALASGAHILGWHSWMANNSGAFAGHGLRDDTGDEMTPPEEEPQRPSWFAYRRFTSLLSCTARGSMVLPKVADRDALVSFLASGDVHPFVVFRYEGTFSAPPLGTTGRPVTGLRYAWLVLRDPSVPTPGVLRLLATWRDPAWTGRALNVELDYRQIAPGATLPGQFPVQEAVYGPSTEADLCSPMEFLSGRESGPVLLFSTEEILWAVV